MVVKTVKTYFIFKYAFNFNFKKIQCENHELKSLYMIINKIYQSLKIKYLNYLILDLNEIKLLKQIPMGKVIDFVIVS